MLHKKIEQLIPYVSENFITYPLWEEGIYLPSINFWQLFDTEFKANVFLSRLLIAFGKKGYDIQTKVYDVQGEDVMVLESSIHFSIQPNFTYTDDGGYEVVNKDWSLEEMVDILVEFLNEKK